MQNNMSGSLTRDGQEASSKGGGATSVVTIEWTDGTIAKKTGEVNTKTRDENIQQLKGTIGVGNYRMVGSLMKGLVR